MWCDTVSEWVWIQMCMCTRVYNILWSYVWCHLHVELHFLSAMTSMLKIKSSVNLSPSLSLSLCLSTLYLVYNIIQCISNWKCLLTIFMSSIHILWSDCNLFWYFFFIFVIISFQIKLLKFQICVCDFFEEET